MRIGAKTDKGKVREQNEDAYGYHDNLFVLADGMGGHCAGEIASAIAVETVLNMDLKTATPDYALKEAVYQANQAILNAVAQNPAQFGMGTTIAVLYLIDNLAYLTHIGDSRGHRLPGRQPVQHLVFHWVGVDHRRGGRAHQPEAGPDAGPRGVDGPVAAIARTASSGSPRPRRRSGSGPGPPEATSRWPRRRPRRSPGRAGTAAAAGAGCPTGAGRPSRRRTWPGSARRRSRPPWSPSRQR